ncbi:hypothetical protein DRN86_00065 [Candidatus Geothermarchaeota archaeon]|nr:MAG: hypothetical protein DRN86_00065 [Candidatus Geothermarchaeota archaeon]
MSIESINVIVPPVRTKVEDAYVDILEVLKFKFPNGEVRYHVTCRIEWRGIRTRVFFIDCKDIEEFKQKISIELAKLKIMYLTLGLKGVLEVVGK